MNGVSRHAANLAAALLRTNLISELHFIAGAWQKEMFSRLCAGVDPRFHAHFIPLGDANLSRLRWYYRDLPQIAAQLGAHVVHFACPAPMKKGAYRCSTVVSLHDLYPFDIPSNFGPLSSIATRHIMARCIRNVDAIACVSESTRDRLAARFPDQAHKALTICNVVEPDGALRPPAVSFIPEGRAFLLCVAQHRTNKNIALAIRVFEQILNQRLMPCNAQLVVIGIPGPETRGIRELIRALKLEHNVLLLSGLSEAELQWCYRHSRLLLAPSTIEGFGLPVAEALLSGCPVVCSDIPAFREIGAALCNFVPASNDPIRGYVETIRRVLALPRPVPAELPQFAALTVGHLYLDLYETLACRAISGFWYATATRT
jgi:glycosyltransferase involved in cell wall biosynthesis